MMDERSEAVGVNVEREGFDVTGGIPAVHDGHVSVRRFEHGGHDVEIETTYRIVIDGVEFPDPIHVGNDGAVHYHGFPQYSAASAVDIVKLIIDRSIEGDPPPIIGGPGPDDGHGGHGGGHDHHPLDGG